MIRHPDTKKDCKKFVRRVAIADQRLETKIVINLRYIKSKNFIFMHAHKHQYQIELLA